jgi:nicotinic acid mononucleotide adenylyltransferase
MSANDGTVPIENKSSGNAKNEKEIILVTTGTFNPPHRGHVAMMEQAVAHLRSLGFVIRRVLFSPSHQEYVERKVNRSKDPNRLVFSGDQRAELVATALAASSIADIASVSRIELDAPSFIEHTRVCGMIQQRHGLPVVFVAGSDLAVRLRGWYSKFAVCVIGRTDRSYPTSIEPSREDSSRMALIDLSNRRQVMLENHKQLRFLVPTTDDVSIATASSTAVNDGDWTLLPRAIIPLVEKFAGIKIPIDIDDDEEQEQKGSESKEEGDTNTDLS